MLHEAEQLLQTQEANDTERLLYDLHLHKVELEIQNRDLRDSQQALEDTRDRYAELYDCSPTGYLTLDENGIILALNLTAAAMLGRERGKIIGKPLRIFLTQDCSRTLSEHLRLVFSSGSQSVGSFGLRDGLDGRGRDVRLDSRLQIDKLAGARSCLTTLIDVTEQKLSERKLRETLIMEVHHRIKNHLQGVVGLLDNLRLSDSISAAAIDKIISQVYTISTVYGLQSGIEQARVELSELLHACVNFYGSSRRLDTNIRKPVAFRDCLAPEESVPIALIINELMANAVKHCPAALSDLPLRVEYSGLDGACHLRISNPCVGMPSGFDFSAGFGLGTGLNLLRALLPSRGARLAFREEETWWHAELFLEPPVLSMKTGS